MMLETLHNLLTSPLPWGTYSESMSCHSTRWDGLSGKNSNSTTRLRTFSRLVSRWWSESARSSAASGLRQIDRAPPAFTGHLDKDKASHQSSRKNRASAVMTPLDAQLGQGASQRRVDVGDFFVGKFIFEPRSGTL